jgi:hypothetical protein
LETAKFCGNCGSPFPRSAPPASSLLNCAQGHVYSAVYEHCPYCPQPDRPAAADFATRIESPLDTPNTVLDTAIDTPLPSTPPPVSARTEKMRRDYATLIDPGAGGVAAFTDPIKSSPTAETQLGRTAPTEARDYSTQGPGAQSNLRTNPVPDAPPPPPPPEVIKTPLPVRVPSLPADAGKQRVERRTLVVPSDGSQPSKGQLVGWLVTFNLNQDGTDYRLRAGRNLLGANPSCDIIVEDDAVSSVHASIVYRNGRCFIKDELSSNGTFVNEVEIQEPRQLQSYDEIRVGNTTLTFVALERSA